MASAELSTTALTFTDASANTATVNFVDTEFVVNKHYQVSELLVDGSLDPGSSLLFAGEAVVDTLIADTLVVRASDDNDAAEISVEVTTDSNYSLSLPLPGSENQFLKFTEVDASTGTLSWDNLYATGNSREQSWIYGEIRQLWSSLYGNPFSPTHAILRTMTASGYAGNTAANPSFDTQSQNQSMILFSNATNKQSVVSWENSNSDSQPNTWEMRICARIQTPLAPSNTNRVYGGFYMFGNSDYQYVSAGPGGGHPADSTKGIAVGLNFYDSNDFANPVPHVDFYQNGVLVDSHPFGGKLLDNQYRMYRVQRRNNTLRFEIFGNGDVSDDSSHSFYEWPISPSADMSGKRWGLLDFSSTYSNHSTYVCSIECRTIEPT